MNTFTHNTVSRLIYTTFMALFCMAAMTPAEAVEPVLPPATLVQVDADHAADSLAVVTNIVNNKTHKTTARPRDNVDDEFKSAASAPDPQQEISGRYSSSEMVGFLNRTSMQEISSLYMEASQMIDARHVSPPAYEQRVQGAITSLINATKNDFFLRASGASQNPSAVAQLERELWQLTQSQPARSANEAVAVMQWAAELVNRRLGVRREAAALEFFNGTIDSLDKYSAFMPSVAGYSPGAELDVIKTAGLDENIVGIGVEMKTHAAGALIVGVVENSPAAQLGLQEGDILIGVNRRSVAGQNLNQIADQIAGQAGTQVSVDIDRNGQKYRGTMTRRSFYVSSVTGVKMVDSQNGVGYARLKQFSESSKKDLEAALWKLHREGMKSLVLDLRGNPGGLLDQAISVSDLFVPCGTIVSTKGRNSSDNTKEDASYEKTWSTPLVVLVDENSASASEIFGAAIQENGRGVIVGRRSYGKGTVQTHFPLRTVSGHLKLTTAKFYSPQGREMAGAGVNPDVPVSVQTEVLGYRGTNQDADINAALQVIGQGIPAQMAARSAQCQRASYQQSQPLQNYGRQLQLNGYTPNGQSL